MKKIGILLIVLLMFSLVSCKNYEVQNARLTYEVKEIKSADLVNKDMVGLIGFVTGGVGGLIVADVATDTLGKLQVTDNLVKTETYVLVLRAIGDTQNPIVPDGFATMIEVEGNKGTWNMGDLVETEQFIKVKKNDNGEYRITPFSNAETSYFYIK